MLGIGRYWSKFFIVPLFILHVLAVGIIIQLTFYLILCFRILKNIEEDTIGKIFSDNISKKSGISKSDTLVSKLLLKVLKHIKNSKVYRNGQRVTCYSGVYWNSRPLNDTYTIQWEAVADLLPKSVIVLRQDSECISIPTVTETSS